MPEEQDDVYPISAVNLQTGEFGEFTSGISSDLQSRDYSGYLGDSLELLELTEAEFNLDYKVLT